MPKRPRSRNDILSQVYVGLAGVLTLAAACATDPSRIVWEEQEPRTWSKNEVTEIFVGADNGALVVTDDNSEQLVAVITRGCEGSSEADARMGIELIEVTDRVSDGRLSIEAETPDESDARQCWVDVELSAPGNLPMELRTVNGAIAVDGLSGGAILTTTNGAIAAVNHRGSLTAACTNGAIEVDQAVIDNADLVELTVVNGAVLLRLPPDAAVSFDASTANGEVAITGFSDVSYSVAQPSRKMGTIGGGGAAITVSVATGGIVLASQGD